MPRRARPESAQRSERWLRVAVNERLEIINPSIRAAFGWPENESIEWLSPLRADAFAEYYDESFLERLRLSNLPHPLSTFWPASGARWDGLARAGNRVVLIEAKAHIDEMVTDPSSASPRSLDMILRSIAETKGYIQAREKSRWDAAFYQYVNRWAHLYHLRVLNKVDAYLVFIYFTDAPDVPLPATVPEWKAAIRVLKAALGLNKPNRLTKYVADVFISARDLAT